MRNISLLFKTGDGYLAIQSSLLHGAGNGATQNRRGGEQAVCGGGGDPARPTGPVRPAVLLTRTNTTPRYANTHTLPT
jgi:hypothetical protein